MEIKWNINMFSRIMPFYDGRKKFGNGLYIWKYAFITIKTMKKNLSDFQFLTLALGLNIDLATMLILSLAKN